MPMPLAPVREDRVAPMLIPDIVREEADNAGVHLSDWEVEEIAASCGSGFRPDIAALVRSKADRRLIVLFA